jgi:hypothetical protein
MDSAQRRRKEFGQSLRKHLVEYLLVIAVALIGKFGASPIEHYVTRAYIVAVRVIGLYGTQFLIGSGIVSLGLFAHWFKARNQRLYGIVEVLFGSLSAFAIAFSLSSDNISLTEYASLIGSSYVVARGVNNMSEAKRRLTDAITERDLVDQAP